MTTRTTAVRTGALLAALASTSACSIRSSHMTPVARGAEIVRPADGKALVFFTRPSAAGGAVQATIYDGDIYIGTVSGGTHVAYETTPGTHLFMVIAESADFMRADLLPGRTYYTGVHARMGVWRARFSFVPFNGTEIEDGRDEVGDSRQVIANDEGRRWASDNAPSIAAKKAKYLPAWQRKSDPQTLHADSGI
jgi:hypothetical protein